jgi:hypothetical protein
MAAGCRECVALTGVRGYSRTVAQWHTGTVVSCHCEPLASSVYAAAEQDAGGYPPGTALQTGDLALCGAFQASNFVNTPRHTQ